MMAYSATTDAHAVGKRDRAQITGDHIEGAISTLHTHHVLEDDNVWPLLLDRCAESVAPLVELMKRQHHQIARLIPQVDQALNVWRDSPTVESRQAVVDILDRLIPALKEHLSTEEDRVVPLMEQHITATEWNEFLKSESAAVDPDYLPLMLGMLMYEGDPESVEQIIATMSADTGPAIRQLAAPTFAAHSLRVHGTRHPTAQHRTLTTKP